MADVELQNLSSITSTSTESQFVLNGLGLLGGGTEATLACSDSRPEVENASMFTSNGLLGNMSTSSRTFNQHSQDTPSTDAGFVSNGLLDAFSGSAKKPAGHMSSGNTGSTATSTAENDDVDMTSSTFVSTGLLGTVSGKDSLSNGSFVTNGLLDDIENSLGNSLGAEKQAEEGSQDDLPSVSQLFRRYGIDSGSSTSSANTGAYAISATTYDGKTILLKKKRKVVKTPSTTLESRTQASLLEVPVHKLKDRLSESLAQSLADAAPSTSTSNKTLSKTSKADLWVDRYRPQRFTDLLGDERVHRETMGWLKEWDYCVFKKKKPNAKKLSQDNNNNSEYKYQDTFDRPREKILLLSGPAGLGKTTLAHVAARHAGYDVLEINASDARTGQVIEDRIQPALESGSAIGAKRPVCVVIDEIDGATGAGDNSASFVHKLVGLTFDKPGKKARSKKESQGSRPLLRPIICICNDLYSSALTKLRQHARIIRFNRPADIYVTKRLRHICDFEGLRADSRALTTLVGLARGDMRCCLNTLQFIRSKSAEVTEPLVRNAAAGLKEADASSTSVLNSLFAPIPRKRVKELALSEEEEKRYVGRLSTDLEASGALDKVAVGCFEHYAKLRHYDATLDRHEKGIQWLMDYDVFSGTMKSEREYGLLPYLSYAIVPFFPLFHERGGEKVERPSTDWEAHVQTKSNEEIFKSLCRCVQTAAGQQSVGLRHLLSNQIMQLEFAPYINRIISPPLRPVNSQVTRPSERVLLTRLVEIMVSLELRFVQDKTEEGQMIYVLDPPVDTFITYDGKRASDIAAPRYAVRHLVAAMIDAQLVARQAEATERGRTTKPSMFKSSRIGVDDQDLGDGAAESPTNSGVLGKKHNLLSRNETISAKKRKADELDPADKPPVDFFGRPIVVPVKKQVKIAASVVEKPYKVFYRFNEGNSAAVRRPVKVSSFL